VVERRRPLARQPLTVVRRRYVTRLPWFPLFACLLGCVGSEEAEEGPSNSAPVPEAPEAPAVPAPYLEAIREAMTSGPEAVLKLYLAWDTAGYRFSGDGHGRALYAMNCFLPEENCYSPEPGWDMVVVVHGYSWEPILVSGDSAMFAVTYDQIGELPQYPNSVPFSVRPADTVRIRHMEGGWHLAGFIRPHVSLARAWDFSRSALDSTLVREWLGAGTNGSIAPSRADSWGTHEQRSWSLCNVPLMPFSSIY